MIIKRYFRLAAPAARVAMAAPPARGGSTPQSIAARRGAAIRGLNIRLRMRDAAGSGVFPVRGPRSGSSGKAGGMIGDALTPRRLMDAILDGAHLGRCL
jgi:hypothetical protein